MNLSVVHQLDIGINYLVPTDDIRPAKITLKGVKELGLEESVWCNKEVHYMHELQREIKNLIQLNS